MNTPTPCDTCKNLYYDCMLKNDPTYVAECKLNLELGNINCDQYEPYNQRIERTAKGATAHA